MLESKLPRELRDMIYKHLCVSDGPIKVDIPDENKGAGSVATPQMQADSHFLNPQFMGVQLAQEAAEVYYSSNTFKLYHDAHVGTFLRNAPFIPDLAPFKYVRDLEVRICFESLVADHDQALKHRLSQLHDELRFSLGQVEKKAQLRVTFVLVPFNDAWNWDDHTVDLTIYGEAMYFNVLEAIRVVVYDLIPVCGQVRVLESIVRRRRDRTNEYFPLTAEEWKEIRPSFSERPKFVDSSSTHSIAAIDPLEEETVRFLFEERWGKRYFLRGDYPGPWPDDNDDEYEEEEDESEDDDDDDDVDIGEG
ncbi:hypothetical protein BDV95DRAFT_194689 [Massariosphaeria phaeospora]|uniref:Uncharacterized protein n=1 Tax=Massariosphaeria phaeospora TaxID=100035 RepID=A0A7C8I7Z1_9PLEO|nr:hypothetical protein BDV95DRAFT_194689 [Massariosphaeria phaeospora]